MKVSDNARSPRGDKSVLRRMAPPLAFICALSLLVVLCYESGYTGLPPTEKRYTAAKAGIENLKLDARKSAQRESWEKLAKEFQSIYDADPSWPNRPAALFRAGESLEELTRRSCSRADARKAIACYENLALRHASSRLADDALFRAANLRAAWLKDDAGALALLKRLKSQYPRGDMVAQAIALERALLASANGKTSSEDLRKAAATPPKIKDEAPAELARVSKNSFAGDLPLRYKAAKSRAESLRADNTRSCWRQPWEELREEFLRIYKSGKNRLAPQALFQAAACQHALAQCSRLDADRKKALEMYLDVPKQFPRHSLADDALLAAARVQRDLPAGKQKALTILARLTREYPSGDMAGDARRLRSLIEGENYQAAASREAAKAAGAKAKKTVAPELQVLSWDSPNKNCVQIVLEMSAPVKYTAKLEEKKGKQPARLLLNLENAAVVNDVRKGVTVQGSLLKAVRVESAKNGPTLKFDFRDARKFDVRAEKNPPRIILSVAAGNAKLPKTSNDTLAAKTAKTTEKAAPIRQVNDLAAQLGLTVRRVFIDAGHGGKDPGTNHNNIIERAITLDLARAVGRLLTANGLEVVYSRSGDNTVKLSDRARLANRAGADLFVSIHVNAHENANINGFETYYLDLASTPQAARVAALENAGSDRRVSDMQKLVADVMLNARAGESRRLASDIQRAAMFRLKKREFATRDNGVKSAPFHVLCGTRMPAALVEVGYCTNPTEARNLARPQYRNALAEGLAEGILAYRDRLLRNRTAATGLTGKKSGAM
ncbi:MAG: N-acetylmuramoyl-L-alanine amidase [Desulfovibrio sp.]|nr:N-acetylmuramoyl-L-alanine amidase [Desulfovibrio sp.]